MRKNVKKLNIQTTRKKKEELTFFFVLEFFPPIEIKALQKTVISQHLARQKSTRETQSSRKEKTR